MDPFVGEIRVFGFGFAPKGWALCNGTLQSISQNTALFSLLGTQYGGDGRTTFAVPNLNGNISVGSGQGTGLANYVQGQVGGSATVSLTIPQLPAHGHALPTTTGATADTPSASVVLGGQVGRTAGKLYDDPGSQAGHAVTMSPALVGPAGSGAAHNNMAPYTVANYCIALQGIYPPRP